MPIILNDDAVDTANLANVVKKLKPNAKYFSQSLTGTGGKSGLLNETNLPIGILPQDFHTDFHDGSKANKYKTQVGLEEIEFLPTNFIIRDTYLFNELPEDSVDISKSQNESVMMKVLAKDILVIKNTASKVTKIEIKYNVLIMENLYTSYTKGGDYQFHSISTYTLSAADFDPNNSNNLLHSSITIMVRNEIDSKRVEDYIKSLTNYDIIGDTSEIWRTKIPTILQIYKKNSLYRDWNHLIQIMNNYQVNLADFKSLYTAIQQSFNNGHINAETFEFLINSNLNLLLNEKLDLLQQIKPMLPTFTPIPYTNPNGLSSEQINAVTSTEPLNIIQAGAGTGKSTCIKNRLEYLQACGEDMGQIMVLSFTNAAANHILEITPKVNSMTIASMINDIYMENWNHMLSSNNTVENIIEATINQDPGKFQSVDIAHRLSRGLHVIKTDINAGTLELSKLVKDHFDEVIQVLTAINQTTLELQALICYHADPSKLNEKVLNCKHLIMDEVQDTSIFEFIFVVDYVIRHKCLLYMVGDGAQTLYEFRASNPKALNTLEMSGIFNCLKLQTNYRSNQNILDYGNVFLKQIEANQVAKIQLQSNILQRANFLEQVQYSYSRIASTNDIEAVINGQMARIKPWIEDKLNKNEQVAFLAFTRKHITMFETALELLFPNNTYKNIVPAKTINQAYFSKYIHYFGGDFHHVKGNDPTLEIRNHIIGNLEFLTHGDYQQQVVQDDIVKWTQENQANLIQLDKLLTIGNISDQKFKADIFQTLINYEIGKNAMKQHLIAMSNQQAKEEDTSGYNFITSTIHSAKGLEFDNVVLLYDEDKNKAEDSKRMYYVGLTRAKNAEFIIGMGRTYTNQLESAYELVCKNLNITVPTDEDGNDA